MPNPINTRLGVQDVRELIAAKQALDAVVAALHSASWAGSKIAIAALAPVDQVICRIYNRCEPFWLRYIGESPPGVDSGAPQEPQPVQPSAGPPGSGSDDQEW